MEKAFKILRDVKSVVISTVKEGIPQSRIIDILHYDEGGIYFVTLKVKPFYRQLIKEMKIAVTGMNSDYVQVRIVGDIQVMNDQLIENLFEKNPELEKLFPGKNGNDNFSVFYLSKGKGEIFDLSGRENKMNRERFAFGGESVNESGCVITESCVQCGECLKACPFKAISEGVPYVINGNQCDECGICYTLCPADAIELPAGL